MRQAQIPGGSASAALGLKLNDTYFHLGRKSSASKSNSRVITKSLSFVSREQGLLQRGVEDFPAGLSDLREEKPHRRCCAHEARRRISSSIEYLIHHHGFGGGPGSHHILAHFIKKSLSEVSFVTFYSTFTECQRRFAGHSSWKLKASLWSGRVVHGAIPMKLCAEFDLQGPFAQNCYNSP